MTLSSAKQFHPGTWWLFGIAIALSATISQNMLLLFALCILSLGLISSAKKNSQPSIASLKFYALLALGVIATRLIFRIVFNSPDALDVAVISLPTVSLNLGFGSPVSIFGPISENTFQAALTDGLRLAAIILGIGVAATLANPRQLLKSTPAILYEVATAVSMAVNLVPQLVTSFQRVKQARKLRARSKKSGLLLGTLIPVLEHAIENSILLSASMSSRGFGYTPKGIPRLLVGFVNLAAVGFIAIGSFFFLMNGITQIYLVVIGFSLALVSLFLVSSRSIRTRLVKISFSFKDLIILSSSISLLTLSLVMV